MKNYFSNKKSAFFFLLCFIFSGMMPAAEPIFGSAPAGRSGPAGRAGRPLSSSEISAYENQKALKAYEKRNAEIDSRIQDYVMPNHNNAALLYYQAFLLLPELDQVIDAKLSKVRRGIEEPDRQVRTFLGRCLPAIEIYETASRMPQCIWGVLPDNQRNLASLGRKLVNLSFVLLVDARTLAADGKYDVGLEQCLTVRRFARHLSDDPELYRSSRSCDRMALSTIRNILSVMPPDADILAWLQGQLALIQVTSPILERVLQEYLKAKIDMVQSSSIVSLRAMLLKIAADEQARQNIRDLTDVQIRSRAIKAVQNLFGSIFAILHSNKSAEQTKAEIEEVNKYFYALPNKDIIKTLMNIYNELGKEIVSLITGRDNEITEEQKLSEMQKIIDKLAEPNAIELLTKFSNALGKQIDFGFIGDSEIADEQRLVKMQKVINELYDRTLHDWNRHDREIDNKVSGGASKRVMTESLWCNF